MTTSVFQCLLNISTALLITKLCKCITAAANENASDYFCFEESERALLQFKNNENKNMTHLPTIRLIQGYYPSQFAMQYVAYVYLKEKMGVDVEFYPSNDPEALFERYEGYLAENWCHTSNTSNCSPYAPYPRFYFEDIKNDHYDLLFEIWDVMIRTGLGFTYFEADQVLNGGISGVYGEGGWFVPKYMYDEHPEWTLPQHMKYNESLRQLFIDAYTIHSDIDYVELWWDLWADDLATYQQHEFGLPNYTTPIIFGSLEGYAISNHSGKLVDNLLDDGIDWTFAAFGDEETLTQFVMDLYSKGLPFVANLYSPHLDFATKLPNDTEYMQFERVALPRNPNNDVQDVCYRHGHCTFPLSPLYKLGNPKLEQTFPEIVTFLTNFHMGTTDVNEVIAYYEDAKILNESTKHYSWMNASCKWLKAHSQVTDEWYQEITRYDCIFDQDNEQNNDCGFNYFYTSFKDAQNEENAVPVLWQNSSNSIAGQCVNSSLEPLCECHSEFLTGLNCRQSCPGVVGPIASHAHDDEHGVSSSSLVLIANYSFYLCSGHGVCDIEHKACLCEAGFGGADCGVVFQQFSYPTGFIVLWCVMFSICVVGCIVSIVWVIQNKHYKTVKAISPNLSILFTVGLILLCLGTVLYLFHPLNDWICSIRAMIYGVGAIITIAAPLLKTYRVAIIFAQARNLKRIEIPDKKLMVYLVNAVVVETIIVTFYMVLHEVYGGVEIQYLEEYHRIETVCNQSAPVIYLLSANYLYIFTLIIILCFFSFKNRPTHKVFKESRCIYFGSFFSLFVFLVVMLFNVVVDDIEVIVHIQSGAMFIALVVIWSLFYGVRMYKFYKYPHLRMEVSVTNQGSKQRTNSTPSRKDTMEMPSYLGEIYKQEGFQRKASGTGTRTGTGSEVISPSSPPQLDTVAEEAGKHEESAPIYGRRESDDPP